MSTRKTYESDGNTKSQSFELPTTGDVSSENFQTHFEMVDEFDYRKVAEMEKFMNERVLVEIPSTTNKNEDQYIQLGVNGVNQPLLRGKPQWIKRKYLEVLLRSQPMTLETIEEFDPRTGNKVVRLIKTTGEKYSYRVLEDKNPNGEAWRRQILAEAN
jgi:hypothetical protein